MKNNRYVADNASTCWSYSIVLTEHNEVITEAPDTEGFNDKALSAQLSTNLEWVPYIPLNAGGFEALSYRKD